MSASDIPTDAGEPLDAGLQLRLPGRRDPAGAGWTWISEGWKLFARAPLMWVLAVVILFVLAIMMGLVPLLGSLAFQLLQAVFAGGLVFACRSLERGGDFELEHLFAGFTRRFVPLLIVGALLLLGWIVIFLVFAAFAGLSILGAVVAGDADNVLPSIMAASGTLIVGTLVALALAVPVLAAYWFAPALVMLHDVAPIAAMRESFFACLRNFVPFLVYGLLMLVLAIVAMIPFGLGMLVWVPLAITSTYVAYRRIFTDDAPAAAEPARTGTPA